MPDPSAGRNTHWRQFVVDIEFVYRDMLEVFNCGLEAGLEK